MNERVEKCWICGELADTREHRIKRSDIKQVLGEATQNKPLFFHDDKKRNKRLQSLNAKILKGEKDLCAKCNNELTQPHDRSWGKLSSYLNSNWSSISQKGAFRISKIFPNGTRNGMRCVHLYFAKLIGCSAIEGDVSMNIDNLAYGIKANKPIHNFWLSIGATPDNDAIITVSRTDLVVTHDRISKEAVALRQLFTFGAVSVLVEYSITNNLVFGIKNSWHPQCGTKLIYLSDFDDG